MMHSMAGLKKGAKVVDLLALVIPGVVLLSALIGYWQFYCVQNDIPTWIIAKPSDIFTALTTGFNDTLPFLINTCGNILFGFVLAVAIGLALAILLSNSTLLAMAVTPLMVILCCVPMVTLVPLLLVIIGTGNAPKIITIVIQCFALVTMNASVGFANVDPARLELMKSLKATRYQTFRYCMLPSALPSIFTGVKLASVLAMISGVSAEMSGGSGGLGNQISYLVSYSKMPEAFGSILYVAVFGLVLYLCISLLEKKLTKT